MSIGIGQRNEGATRIQIGERNDDGNWIKTIYPSIFNMSAGENALICLFCEIVRQFDKIHPNAHIQTASGVLLIDEIDKHLHIQMQKEVLPRLIQLFPNVQFIISSHSPFATMGLEENVPTKTRTKIIDLDLNGITSDLSATRVFSEGYNAMVEKNNQYKVMYETLKFKVEPIKLQIVTEGNNDKHIKKAIEMLDPSLLDRLEFCFNGNTGWEQLKKGYDAISSSRPQAKYLFVFDCDSGDSVNQLLENDNFFRFRLIKNDKNDKVKKGIENLYPPELFCDNYYTETTKTNDYGAISRIQEFDKNAFLATILNDADLAHFQNFQPLLEKIKSILANIETQQNTEEEPTHE